MTAYRKKESKVLAWRYRYEEKPPGLLNLNSSYRLQSVVPEWILRIAKVYLCSPIIVNDEWLGDYEFGPPFLMFEYLNEFSPNGKFTVKEGEWLVSAPGGLIEVNSDRYFKEIYEAEDKRDA